MDDKEKNVLEIEGVPPLHDLMLSKIFENMETALAVKSFLNAVLEDAHRELIDEITDLRSQQTFMGPSVKSRTCRVDVFATSEKHLTNVESYRYPEHFMIDRSVFYGAAMFQASLRRAQKYEELPILTLVNILDKQILRPSHPDYHQPVQLTYTKGEHEVATDKIFIHNLQLAKFDINGFNKDKAIDRWMYYLKIGYMMPESPATREVLQMDVGLQQFADKYHLSLQDPDFILRYTQIHLAEMDYNSAIYNAESRGVKKERAKANAELKEERAKADAEKERSIRNLKHFNMSDEDIAKALNVSIDKVSSITP
jgi:predicted transposase/invertase (TIGR01784 family)